MKRRYRILRDVSLTRKTTGRTVIFKCEYFKESPEDYILIHTTSPVKSTATLYPKRLWSLAKTTIPGVGASMGYGPPEEKSVTPDDDDEVPPEIIKEIEEGGAQRREGSPGDIKKELPGEYNTNAPHEADRMTSEEALRRKLTMQAHIDSNFARDEGERKYKQALARRRIQEHVERAGAGFVPE